MPYYIYVSVPQFAEFVIVLTNTFILFTPVCLHVKTEKPTYVENDIKLRSIVLNISQTYMYALHNYDKKVNSNSIWQLIFIMLP